MILCSRIRGRGLESELLFDCPTALVRTAHLVSYVGIRVCAGIDMLNGYKYYYVSLSQKVL